MPTSSYIGDVTTEQDIEIYIEEITIAAEMGEARLKYSIELIAQEIERKTAARLHSEIQKVFHMDFQKRQI